MNTVITRQLPRTLIAAGLAFVGTIASFAVTTAPAHAAPRAGYSATLQTALEAPARKVVNDVVWNCAGDSCQGPLDGSAPRTTCTKVVKAFGPVTHFASPKGEFDADQLQRCNAAA